MRLLHCALFMGLVFGVTSVDIARAQDAPNSDSAEAKQATESDSADLSVPIISLKTAGPKQIESDRPAKYKITVRNVSSKQDASLKLYVTYTTSSKFMNASPFPQEYKQGVLEYDIQGLPRLQERSYDLTLWPPSKGSIEVKARYVLKTETNIATHVKRPQIRFDVTGPNEVDVSNPVPYSITITNPGDGVIRDMIVEPIFPNQVTFVETDGELSTPFTIKANEKKVLKFKLTGHEPGDHRIRFKLHIANLPAQIVQSALRVHTRVPNVHFAGPAEHVIGETGDYTIIVENRSKMMLSGSELVVDIPDFIQVHKISHPCQFRKSPTNKWQMVWTLGDIQPEDHMVYRLRGKAISADNGTARLSISANGEVVRQKEYAIAATKQETQSSVPQQMNSNSTLELQPTPSNEPIQVAPSKEAIELNTVPVSKPTENEARIPSLKPVETSNLENAKGNSVRFLIK